ncbi:DUF1453 domain-containing protein [Streptomyces sp. NPDC049577]|uniref:DUF1453 domain-containing protein n=1 Tax=Streptomyces sp. NPDC049577 TaxID=3155153 RepID=UPI0034195A9D
MSGPVDVLVIVAVCVLVVARQLRPQKVAGDARSWWVLPAVLVFMAVREHSPVDSAHPAASAGLLAAGVLAGLATGAAWAWTTRIWTDASGTVWAAGSRATAAIWAGGMVLRLGLYGVGVLAGVRQDSSAAMLTVAAVLLARTGLIVHRSRNAQPAYGVPAGG